MLYLVHDIYSITRCLDMIPAINRYSKYTVDSIANRYPSPSLTRHNALSARPSTMYDQIYSTNKPIHQATTRVVDTLLEHAN